MPTKQPKFTTAAYRTLRNAANIIDFSLKLDESEHFDSLLAQLHSTEDKFAPSELHIITDAIDILEEELGENKPASPPVLSRSSARHLTSIHGTGDIGRLPPVVADSGQKSSTAGWLAGHAQHNTDEFLNWASSADSFSILPTSLLDAGDIDEILSHEMTTFGIL